MNLFKNLLPGLLFTFISGSSFAQLNFQIAYNLDGNQMIPVSMAMREDSGYYVLSNANFDAYLDRFDPQGNALWHKKLSSPYNATSASVKAAPNGGCFVTGVMIPNSQQSQDIYVSYLDSTGDILWCHSFGYNSSDLGTDVIPWGASCIASGSYIRSGSQRGVLLKIGLIGQGLVWFNEFRDTIAFNSYINRVISAGSDVLLCTISQYGPPSTNGTDGGLVLVDSSGNMMQNKVYHFPEWGQFGDAKMLPGGGFIVSGYIDILNDSINNRDFFLMKTDAQLNVIWAKAYARPNEDIGNSVLIDTDGGYIITGALNNFSSTSSTALLKVDSNGVIQWSNQFFTNTTSPTGNSTIPAAGNGFMVLSTRQQSPLIKNYVSRVGSNGIGYCNDSTAQFTATPVSLTTTSPFAVSVSPPMLYALRTMNSTTANYNESVICLPSGIDTPEISEASVYPNPSGDGTFTIQWSGTQPVFSCFDITGRAVPFTAEATGEGQWRIGPLPRGLYMLRISEADAASTIKLFSAR